MPTFTRLNRLKTILVNIICLIHMKVQLPLNFFSLSFSPATALYGVSFLLCFMPSRAFFSGDQSTRVEYKAVIRLLPYYSDVRSFSSLLFLLSTEARKIPSSVIRIPVGMSIR